MKQFKVNLKKFSEIRKQRLILTIPYMIIATAAGITIVSLNSKDKPQEITIWPYYLAFIGIVTGFGLYRGLVRLKKLLKSYTLTIDNNMITRYQVDTPTISLYYNEIKEIIKDKRGRFFIKGNKPTDIIIISAQIENYSELEETLNRIMQVTTKKDESLLEKYRHLLALLTLGLMLCVYTVTNKIIVTLCGALLVILMVWNLSEIRKNKNIDYKSKRMIPWILLVLASVIAVVLMKITGAGKT